MSSKSSPTDSFPSDEKTQVEREDGNAGTIKFRACFNDLSDENSVLLMAARDLYRSLLPALMTEIIIRQLLENTHKSIVAITDGRVIGAVTYHPFPGHMFAEIVMLAVSVVHQRHGLGNRLMDFVKHIAMQRDNVSQFVVFATQESTRFFSNQGFVEELALLDHRRMKCCDKLSFHYSVPMELNIQPDSVPCSDSSASVEMEFGQFPTEIFAPGLSPELWDMIDYDVDQEDLPNLLNAMVWSLRAHPDCYPFLVPVDPVRKPDYYEVVSDPIDLTIVTKRVESGKYYRRLDVFVSDLRTMFENWKKYRGGKTLNGYLSNKFELHFYDKLRVELNEVRKRKKIRTWDMEMISSCGSSSEDDDSDEIEEFDDDDFTYTGEKDENSEDDEEKKKKDAIRKGKRKISDL